MANPTRIVIAHPDDVNLADCKALAAKYNTTVVGNPCVPRGHFCVVNPLATDWSDYRIEATP